MSFTTFIQRILRSGMAMLLSLLLAGLGAHPAEAFADLSGPVSVGRSPQWPAFTEQALSAIPRWTPGFRWQSAAARRRRASSARLPRMDRPSRPHPLPARDRLDERYRWEAGRIDTEADLALSQLIPASYRGETVEQRSLQSLLQSLRDRLAPDSRETPDRFLIGLHAAVLALERESSTLSRETQGPALIRADRELRGLWSAAGRRWSTAGFAPIPADTSILQTIRGHFIEWRDARTQEIENDRLQKRDQLRARHRLQGIALELEEEHPLTPEAQADFATRPPLTRQNLLQEIAPFLVQHHPALHTARTLLDQYRTQRQNAARAGDYDSLSTAQKEMAATVAEIRRALDGFTFSGEIVQVWQSDMEELTIALDFMKRSYGHPFIAMMLRQVAQRLMSEPWKNPDLALLQGIGVTDTADQEWTEFWAALDLEQVHRHLQQASLLEPVRQHLYLRYLMEEGVGQGLSWIALEQWWDHPPVLHAQDAEEWIEGLRRPQGSADLSEGLSARLEEVRLPPWVARYGAMAAIAALVIVGVSGVIWMAHGLVDQAHPFDSPPGSNITNSGSASGASTGIFGGPELAARLQEVQRPISNDPAVALERTRTVARLRRELQSLRQQENAAHKQADQRQQALAKAQANVEETEQRLQEAEKAMQSPPPRSNRPLSPSTQKRFEEASRQFQKGEPIDAGAGPRSRVPQTPDSSTSAGGTVAHAPEAGYLGPRTVQMRFEKPVSGYIREIVSDRFNRDLGQWESAPLALSNATRVARTPGAAVVNRAIVDLTSRVTRLAIPEEYAPIRDSFSFSSPVTFDLHQDREGHYALIILNNPVIAGLQVQFDLRIDDHPSWLRVEGGPATQALMEDVTLLKADTQAAINRAKSAGSFGKMVAILQGHIETTMEYTISDTLDAHQRQTPRHYVAGIDGYQETLGGTHYRLGDCDVAATYIAAMARAAGLRVRMVDGYAAFGSFQEISSWQAHTWVEIYNDSLGQWVRIDPLVPDRMANGVERQFAELPVSQPVSEELIAARARNNAALEDLEDYKRRKAESQAALQALQEQQSQIDDRLKALQKANSPSESDSLRIVTELMKELNATSERMTANPAAVSALMDHLDTEIANYRAMLTAANVDSGIQVRYLAKILELAMAHLSPTQRARIYPVYLQVLNEWIKDPNAERPVVFDAQQTRFISLLRRLREPATTPPPLQEIKTTAYHFDVSGSFPIPLDTVPSDSRSHGSSLVLPSLEDGNAQWIQNETDGIVRGFATPDRIYDLNGSPVFLPDTDAVSISPVGEAYALIRTREGQQNFLHVPTGKRVPVGIGFSTISDAAMSSDGTLHFLAVRAAGAAGETPWIGGTVSMNSGQSYSAPVPYNRLITFKGDVYGYDYAQTFPGLINLSHPIEPDIPIPWASHYPSGGTKHPNRIEIDINPVSKELFWWDSTPGHEGIYKMDTVGTRVSIQGSRPGRPIFDPETGVGYYEDSPADNDRPGTLRQVYAFGSSVPLETYPGTEHLIGRFNGVSYRVGRGLTGEFNDAIFATSSSIQRAFGFFPLGGEDNQIILLNGSLAVQTHFEGKPRIVLFSKDFGTSSFSSRVLSSPQADDVSSPTRVGDRVLFAEHWGGTWHWKMAGGPSQMSLEVKHVTSDGKVYFTVKSADRPSLYLWDGTSTTELTPPGTEFGKVYGVGDDVYWTRSDASGRRRLYQAGRQTPISPPGVEVLDVTAGPDGSLYLAGRTSQGMVLQKGEKQVQLFPMEFPGLTLAGALEEMSRFGSGDAGLFKDGAGHLLMTWRDTENAIILHRPVRTVREDGQDVSWSMVNYDIKPIPDQNGFSAFAWVATTPEGNWRLRKLSDGGIYTAVEFTTPPLVEVAPDGALYFLHDQTLWKVDKEGRMTSLAPGQVARFDMASDGTVYYWTNSDSPAGFKLYPLNDAVPLRTSPEPGTLYFAPRSRTGILWEKVATDSMRPSAVVGTRPPVLLSNTRHQGIFDPSTGLLRSMPPQTGPRHTSVMRATSDGQSLLFLDPSQEMDRLLSVLVQLAWSDPALFENRSYDDLVYSLISRSFPSAGRQVLQWAITASDRQVDPGNQQAIASLINNIPHESLQEQEAIRAELAQVVTTLYQQYRERAGSQPFNPDGIVGGTDFLSRLLNCHLQTFMGRSALRVGGAEAETLRRLNLRLSDLAQSSPWLRLSPQDLKEVWLSPAELTERWILEALRQPTIWFIGVESLAFLLGEYVFRKQRASQQLMARVVRSWASDLDQSVFLHSAASEGFSLRRAVQALPAIQQATFAPYVEFFEQDSSSLQGAVWTTLLHMQGLVPIPRTAWQAIYKPLLVAPVLKEALQARKIERLLRAALEQQRQEAQSSDRFSSPNEFMPWHVYLKGLMEKKRALMPSQPQNRPLTQAA